MPRKHVILFLFSITFLSTAFYLAIPVNLSFFEHNDQAKTVVDGEIASIAIPITWSDHGHPLLPVSVNGASDLLFQLDTGSPLTVIFGHQGTEEVPLRLGRGITIGGVGIGARAEGRVVEAIEIAIGPVKIEDLKALWLDWQNVPFFPSESHVFMDGIIGYDLFSRFIVELDTTNDLLRLHKSLETVSDVSGRPISIDFKNRKPYGKVEVIIDDDKPTPIIRDALLDTGLNIQLELITPADATKAFPPLPEELVHSPSIGFQGKVDRQKGRIDQLEFGNQRFENVLIDFAEPHGGASEGEAILGMGLLSRFGLVFDYPGQQLFLAERSDSFADFDLDMSGLEIVRRGERTIVSNVVPGTSAAKANFRSGDTITQIEGFPASNLKKARALLQSGDGKKISVCRMTRKGEKCKTLRLQRQI